MKIHNDTLFHSLTIPELAPKGLPAGTVVYASAFARCVQTAVQIAAVLNVPVQPVIGLASCAAHAKVWQLFSLIEMFVCIIDAGELWPGGLSVG